MIEQHDRDLETQELRALVQDIAAQPELWVPHVAHDPEQRMFTRLHQDDFVSVWLICWMPGHDTGFHDHDGSGGAVAVLDGAVREERLRLLGDPIGGTHAAGASFSFDGAEIHRVTHAGKRPAVTVHAYSPVLRRMGQYTANEDGQLLREALDEDTELVAA
ncbi:MAG: cysteine dioxygenase family protein [Solirubrobacteraceae bacterium]|nr:cysteine dioxygenase family protein [Solirubrobacteraceae bacterium]